MSIFSDSETFSSVTGAVIVIFSDPPSLMASSVTGTVMGIFSDSDKFSPVTGAVMEILDFL